MSLTKSEKKLVLVAVLFIFIAANLVSHCSGTVNLAT
jgi:hypothetical protein